MIGEPFTARFVTWRTILMVAGSAGFVAAGLWMVGAFGEQPNPNRAWAGWLCIVFFSLCGMAAAKRLFDSDAQLRISPAGIQFKQWSDATIPWQEISDIGVWSYRNQRMIMLTLRNPDRFPSKTLLGRIARANKVMTGGDVTISLTGTDKSFDQTMAAIDRYRPR